MFRTQRFRAPSKLGFGYLAYRSAPLAIGCGLGMKRGMLWTNSTQKHSFLPTKKVEHEKARTIHDGGHKPKVMRVIEDIYTLPNLITLSRILMTPFIGYAIITHSHLLSFSLLVIASGSDWLDGYIARRFNQKTFLGSALDPIADKVLMTVLVCSLTYTQAIPIWLATLIFGRDVSLVLGAMVLRYTSLPKPKTIQRYFDVTLPSADVQPPLISKINTALQLATMLISLAASIYGFVDHWAMDLLRYTVATTTVWSGLHYVIFRDAIKILK